MKPLCPKNSTTSSAYHVGCDGGCAGDFVPPHIDERYSTAPVCTISLLSEQPTMFGSRLYHMGPGAFGGSNCLINLLPVLRRSLPFPIGAP